MIFDSPEANQRLSDTAAEAPPATFMERFQAADKQAQASGLITSRLLTMSEDYDRRIKAIKDAGLGDLSDINPMTSNRRPQVYSEGHSIYDMEPLDFSNEPHKVFQKRLEELAQKYPEQAHIIGADKPVTGSQAYQAAKKEAEATSSSYGGAPLTGPIADFAGGMYAMRKDPANVVALVVGPTGHVGKGAKAVLMMGAKQAAANMAVETAMQPFIQSWRKSMNDSYGWWAAAEEIGMAGAFGLGADAGVRMLYRGAQARLGRKAVLDEQGRVVGYESGAASAEREALNARNLEIQKNLEALPKDTLDKVAQGDEEATIALAKALKADEDPSVGGAINALRNTDRVTLDGIDDGWRERSLIQQLRALEDPSEPAPAHFDAAAKAERPRLADDAELPRGTEGNQHYRMLDLDGKPVRFEAVDSNRITTDPATFQFKGGRDAAGASNALKAVDFNGEYKGKVIVYEREDGSLVVADGHDRVSLANRAPEPQKLDALIFREKDGWTAEQVRAEAARKNIQEGTGSLMDVAGAIRRHPEIVDDSMAVSTDFMADARSIARLSDEAFDAVASGQFNPKHGVMVSDLVPDQSRHMEVLRELDRGNPPTEAAARREIGNMLREPANIETLTRVMDIPLAEPHVLEARNEVLAGVLTTLRGEPGYIGEIETQAIASVIRRLSEKPGLVSDVLAQAGRAVAEGQPIERAIDATLRRFEDVIGKAGVKGLADQPVRLASISRGLDMSPEARKARAEQMGFDTSETYFHTSGSKFDAFDLERGGGALGPSFGKGSPFFSGANVEPYYLRLNNKLSFNTGYEVTPRDLVQFVLDGNYKDVDGQTRAVKVDLSPDDRAALANTIAERGWSADRAAIVRDVMRRNGVDGFEFVHEMATETIPFDPTNIRSVNATFDPAEAGSARLMAALSGSDAAVGRSMRADLDRLGYYSKALEAAKSLKQAKGTPEQMLSQLKSAGVKDAEIEATNLKQFLDGKTSVTRDDLVKHLTENRVGVNEVVADRGAPQQLAATLKSALHEARSNGTHAGPDAAISEQPSQTARNGGRSDQGSGSNGGSGGSGAEADASQGLSGPARNPGVSAEFSIPGYVGRRIDVTSNAGLKTRYYFAFPAGVEISTRLTGRAELNHIMAFNKWAARAAMVEREPGRWEISEVKVRKNQRRAGVGTYFYDQMERDMGAPLQPSGMLTDDGYQFRMNRDPESVQWHRKVGDMWLSPKQLLVWKGVVSRLAETAESLPEIRSAMKRNDEINAAISSLPDEAFARRSMDAMFALSRDRVAWSETPLEQARREHRERHGNRNVIQHDSYVARDAEHLTKDVRRFEERLWKDGRSADEIATAIKQRYGFEVDAEDIAKKHVWWRVKDDGDGHMMGTADDNALKSIVQDDEIAEYNIYSAREGSDPTAKPATPAKPNRPTPTATPRSTVGHSVLTAEQAKSALSMYRSGVMPSSIAERLAAETGKYVRVQQVIDALEREGAFKQSSSAGVNPVVWHARERDALRTAIESGKSAAETVDAIKQATGRVVSEKAVYVQSFKMREAGQLQSGRAQGSWLNEGKFQWTKEALTTLTRDDVAAMKAGDAAKLLSEMYGGELTANAVRVKRMKERKVKRSVMEEGQPLFAKPAENITPTKLNELAENLRQALDEATTPPPGRLDDPIKDAPKQVERLREDLAEDIAAVMPPKLAAAEMPKAKPENGIPSLVDLYQRYSTQGREALDAVMPGTGRMIDEFVQANPEVVARIAEALGAPTGRPQAAQMLEQAMPQFMNPRIIDMSKPVLLTPEANARMPDIRRELDRTVQMLPPEYRIRVEDSLVFNFGDGDKRLDGLHDGYEKLIYVSMAAGDPVRTSRHEVIHALRQTGLMKDEEFAALYKFADRLGLRKAYEIDAQYKEPYTQAYGNRGADFVEQLLREETVANMFSDYSLNGRRFGDVAGGGMVDRLIDMIVSFMKQVRDIMGGYGFRNVYDVFESIESGAMANRRMAEVSQGIADGLRRQEGSLEPNQQRAGRTGENQQDRMAGVPDQPGPGYRSLSAGDQSLGAIRAPLDMSPEARKARAEQMGFDTNTVWYHGTRTGRINLADKVGPQPWLPITTDVSLAENFGATSVIPMYLKKGIAIFDGSEEHVRRLKDVMPDRLKGKIDWGQLALGNWFELEGVDATYFSQAGFEGYKFIEKGKPAIAIDPKNNIRSVNATFDPAEAGSARLMAMFAGENAKTADLEALSKAKQMDAEGKPREAIWKDTGWFKGVDGKWRFEISDHKAYFDENAAKDLKDILADDGKAFDYMKDTLPFGGVVGHRDLFGAYPALSDLQTHFIPSSKFGSIKAAFSDKGGGRISFNDVLDAESGRSYGLHESQHAIQAIESFARGGRHDNWPTEMLEAERARIAAEQAARPKLDDWTAVDNSIAPADMTDVDLGRSLYRRLAGEAEARLVQKRMNMTPEERRARPPWLDYDVPEADQIVRMANEAIQMSLEDKPLARDLADVQRDRDAADLVGACRA